MKPRTPREFEDHQELEQEGIMFVGDKGRIIAGFRGESPKVIGSEKEGARGERSEGRTGRSEGTALWVAAMKGGKPTYGDFLLGQPITDAFNLAAVSLRLGGRRLLFDSLNAKITNLPQANKYLTREYRKGWELA
jgi:hypothetical protein